MTQSPIEKAKEALEKAAFRFEWLHIHGILGDNVIKTEAGAKECREALKALESE